nr:helix-turn-helix transcriptional regulator [Spirochaeta isovalerica]
MAVNRIKLARIEKEMTQAELGKLCGVTRQTIGLIESDSYNPTISLCLKLCRVLGRNLDELFGEE